MIKLSRRSIAKYAADQLIAGAKAPALSKQLAVLMVNSKRQSEARLLVMDIMRELEDRGVVARVYVNSAHDLSVELSQEIAGFVRLATKVHDVIVETDTEPNLIGGVRIETANRSWDTTVAKKIDDMRKVF
jgi:F0F1-type ATP synthase delta subunit